PQIHPCSPRIPQRLPFGSDANSERLTPKMRQSLLRGHLLRGLLAPSLPRTDLLLLDDRGHLEGSPVRGTRRRDHLVGYARSALRQKLLQSGLKIDPRLRGKLDP